MRAYNRLKLPTASNQSAYSLVRAADRDFPNLLKGLPNPELGLKTPNSNSTKLELGTPNSELELRTRNSRLQRITRL